MNGETTSDVREVERVTIRERSVYASGETRDSVA
jgi:hypothetical protein